MKAWPRLWAYSRPYWPQLVLSVILMALVGAATGAMPLLVTLILDRVLAPGRTSQTITLPKNPFTGQPINVDSIIPGGLHDVWTLVALGIVGAFLAKGLFDYIANYLVSYSGYSAVTDLRNEVFAKVLRQGARFHEANSTGRVMSSIMNDIDRIQVAISTMMADLLRQSFVALALLYVVLHQDWRLAVFSLTILPFVLLPTARLGRRIRRTSRNTQNAAGEVNEILQEALVGQEVVKAFGADAYELRRFSGASKRLLKGNLRYVLQQAVASPLIEFFAAITIVLLLGYARTRIYSGALSAGQFTSFVLALLLLFEPVKRLTGIHNIFEQAVGASQKVFEYLDEPEDIVNAPDARKLQSFKQAITFERVCFSYPTAPGRLALDRIDLEVKVGEVVALVGASGAGKSTLARLVPRFHDVTSGAVRFDGIDVRGLTLESLRGSIGLVSQDTFLFNDSVAANIAYGQQGVNREAVRKAARAALADEFIERLPEGYDSLIGERGLMLSGGQRQRLAIARAIFKNAPVLILDEATSHLDTESEMLVQKALANLMADRTVIVIAHRISTVRRADKIVVLSEGRIVETGRHEELLRLGGAYARLHELQFLEPVGADL